MKLTFARVRLTGCLLGAAIVITLTGCVGYVDRPRDCGMYAVSPPVYYEQDDYVYYPQYGVYYGNHAHQYYYREGRSWVARPAPRDLSVEVIIASPSVPLEFHDRPSAHHSQVSRTYPKNWKPEKSGRSDDRREDHNR